MEYCISLLLTFYTSDSFFTVCYTLFLKRWEIFWLCKSSSLEYHILPQNVVKLPEDHLSHAEACFIAFLVYISAFSYILSVALVLWCVLYFWGMALRVSRKPSVSNNVSPLWLGLNPNASSTLCGFFNLCSTLQSSVTNLCQV